MKIPGSAKSSFINTPIIGGFEKVSLKNPHRLELPLQDSISPSRLKESNSPA